MQFTNVIKYQKVKMFAIKHLSVQHQIKTAFVYLCWTLAALVKNIEKWVDRRET